MSEFIEVRIAAPFEATQDDIEYEAVRRLLSQCDNQPNKIGRILHRSPQWVRAVLSKHELGRLAVAHSQQQMGCPEDAQTASAERLGKEKSQI